MITALHCENINALRKRRMQSEKEEYTETMKSDATTQSRYCKYVTSLFQLETATILLNGRNLPSPCVCTRRECLVYRNESFSLYTVPNKTLINNRNQIRSCLHHRINLFLLIVPVSVAFGNPL